MSHPPEFKDSGAHFPSRDAVDESTPAALQPDGGVAEAAAAPAAAGESGSGESGAGDAARRGRIGLGIGIGVGSAAIAAAVIYATRAGKRTDKSRR